MRYGQTDIGFHRVVRGGECSEIRRGVGRVFSFNVTDIFNEETIFEIEQIKLDLKLNSQYFISLFFIAHKIGDR